MRDSEGYYLINGVRYPSVTTILGVIDKPALKNWAVRQALNYVRDNLKDVASGKISLEDLSLHKIMEDAKKRPGAVASEAADIGTQAHSLIELDLKGHPDESRKIATKSDGRVARAYEAFLSWRKTVNLCVPRLDCIERKVWSKKFCYAGTADLLCFVNGRPTLLDWKSSRAVWDEHWVQNISYIKAAEEVEAVPEAGFSYEQGCIMRLDKSTGEFDPHYKNREELEGHFDCFLGAMAIFEWRQARAQEKKAAPGGFRGKVSSGR